MSRRPRVCAVIMAGGSGTRFWPLSRKSRPKQFLPIAGGKTMIEETVARLRPLLAFEAIYTISDKSQAAAIRKLVPGLKKGNVLIEPVGRNTAASLILATAHIYVRDPRAVVFALPADHLITGRARFIKTLRAAAGAAAEKDVIVTFGIPPAYPSTGFGYIHYSGRKPRKIAGEVFYPVLGFKEKPKLAHAKKFLARGNHSWNSGMFIWRADVFARKLEEFAPEFFPYWRGILEALEKKDRAGVAAVFREIPATSIDYALMEKAGGVLMVKGDFGWSDVGSWASLADIWPRDEAGNALRGESQFIDSRNCLVYSPRRLTAVVGLEDVIVVDTKDALLVCSRKADQRVKDVIENLRKKGKEEIL
ncbi:MAG: mannose-1-phosphate guanylyltransferase [Candidatus Aminicenantes bacterium]|nr:mannose-1-phosphate guanylyltransferase [Candidatus Aminicenantes bacterium]